MFGQQQEDIPTYEGNEGEQFSITYLRKQIRKSEQENV